MKQKLHVALFLTILLLANHHRGYSQVLINEYCCSNKTLTDNFSNTPDWIELYNTSAASVNLTGYFLSDKINNITRWAFPTGITIAANGYLKVWASGANTVVGTDIHTDFGLVQTKPEAIVLSNPSGTILDSLTLKPTMPDHSRGRTSDGAATWSLFTTPTPAAANTGAKSNYATRPSMTVVPGFYASAQTVSIFSPDLGVTIYYTLDGTTPTTTSAVYSTPIPISTTTVVRARAFSSNPLVPPSFVRSNTYFIGVTHTVPVVSVFGDDIMTLMNGVQGNPETALQYFDETRQLKAESDGESNKHGNDSWAYNQRGIDFISDDELGYNYALNNKLFINKSRASFTHIIFKAAANDNYPASSGGAHIRDSYVHTLSQRGNLHLDERTWAPSILYVNGQYWGVYDTREKVQDNDFMDYYYHQGNTDSLQYLRTWGGTISAYGGAQAQTDWNTLKNYIASNNMAVAANYNHVDSLLNVKSFIDYFLINSWAVTSDWLNWNTAWWRGLAQSGSEHKWRYTLWDNDACFGHYINYTGIPSQLPSADPCAPEALPDPGGQGHTLILDSLNNNPTFKQLYHSRYIDLLNSTFGCDYALGLLDSMIAVIEPEMPRHITKWGGSMSEWHNNVDTLRSFITRRCTQITQGMVSCYDLTGPFNITVDVQPAGAGNVRINSITPSNYIWSGSYYGNIQTNLKATPTSPYIFDHWELNHHSLSPSSISDSVSFMVTTGDDIIAVFRKETEPIGGSVAGVPTAFSPNGDNVNDVLFILGSIQNIDFEVFNRWGQTVFHTTDRNIGWDGTFNGKPLNPGVFAYHLTGRMANGDEVDAKGNITLVR